MYVSSAVAVSEWKRKRGKENHMLPIILLVLMLLAATGLGYQIGMRRGWALGKREAQDEAIVTKMIDIMQQRR
jgi:hypothetical protein